MTKPRTYTVEPTPRSNPIAPPWTLARHGGTSGAPLSHYANEDDAHAAGRAWIEGDTEVTELPPPMGHNAKAAGVDEALPTGPLSPFEAITINIEDLLGEMRLYLDGEPVANQHQSNDLSSLIDKMRKAKKAAEDAKGEEKRPHLDANIAIEARYKPLVTKAETAVKTGLAAITKFLNEQDKIQRELAAAAAASAAAEAKAAADAAREATAAGNLSAREAAEDLIDSAQASLAEAKMLGGLKANAKSEDMTRAIGLTTIKTPVVLNESEVLRHYWSLPQRRAEIVALALDFARKDIRAGAVHIPGIRIDEEKVAR